MITSINTQSTKTFLSHSEQKSPDYSGALFADEIQGISGNLPLDGLILPTFENLDQLSEDFTEALLNCFHESGIPTKPQIDIKYNVEKDEVEIEGNRDDVAEVKELIQSDPELLEKLRTLNSIASHVCEMPEHLAFQKDYLASSDPEEVIMRYSHLFSGDEKQHELTFKFDTNGIDIYYDGEYWVYF